MTQANAPSRGASSPPPRSPPPHLSPKPMLRSFVHTTHSPPRAPALRPRRCSERAPACVYGCALAAVLARPVLIVQRRAPPHASRGRRARQRASRRRRCEVRHRGHRRAGNPRAARSGRDLLGAGAPIRSCIRPRRRAARFARSSRGSPIVLGLRAGAGKEGPRGAPHRARAAPPARAGVGGVGKEGGEGGGRTGKRGEGKKEGRWRWRARLPRGFAGRTFPAG